eukprot:10660778-Karenia_brevis.AAC.1
MKWREATMGPPEAMTEMLEGSDEQFRAKLCQAQQQCQEVCAPVAAQKELVGAKWNQSVKEAEGWAK